MEQSISIHPAKIRMSIEQDDHSDKCPSSGLSGEWGLWVAHWFWCGAEQPPSKHVYKNVAVWQETAGYTGLTWAAFNKQNVSERYRKNRCISGCRLLTLANVIHSWTRPWSRTGKNQLESPILHCLRGQPWHATDSSHWTRRLIRGGTCRPSGRCWHCSGGESGRVLHGHPPIR